MNIKGLVLPEVLAALYNAASTGGMGLLQYDPTPMDAKEAGELLKKLKQLDDKLRFDYLFGRSMKISLGGEQIDTKWYNQYNGDQAAERVIAILRETGNPADPRIIRIHIEGTRAAMQDGVTPHRTTPKM